MKIDLIEFHDPEGAAYLMRFTSFTNEELIELVGFIRQFIQSKLAVLISDFPYSECIDIDLKLTVSESSESFEGIELVSSNLAVCSLTIEDYEELIENIEGLMLHGDGVTWLVDSYREVALGNEVDLLLSEYGGW